jgi:hypothetical protein
MNHSEYKDVFLLQDINIKIHKIMVLICSATLNRLEITTTNYKKKKIPSDQNTQNMKFTSTLKESYTDNSSSSSASLLQRHQFRGIWWCSICTVWWRCTSNKAETCQNRRWKWKWLKYLRINLISTFYNYHWVDTSAGGLLIP